MLSFTKIIIDDYRGINAWTESCND
ncbi:hypothetical protein CNEO4_560057 [Clostridium neonatale]|nr:hypothetical protein CNEO_310020 [Clostridium neonatale]CAI3577046.1 hypothetical protein CNEO4_160020 [Clostridium neonatale]CAI3620455.1 hypothetical protein CNEO4_410072 [Clostridium neonatale]CAI3645238.1 hypothetical protein CNEO4_390075 [Clostridium neonatale]CAI3655268.1 hypothetical protein CNEO4_390075 [Clostridium neonatale]